MSIHPKIQTEDGISHLLFAITSFIFIGAAAFCIDLGFARWEERQLQIVTDAGAMAGVQAYENNKAKSGSAISAAVTAEVNALASENSRAGKVISIEVGKWLSNKTFTTDTSQSGALAVRVSASNDTPTTFAKIWGHTNLKPHAVSVAAMGNPAQADCIIPFGIDDDVLSDKAFGDKIDVSREAPGNWGKIDINGNMSSSKNFLDAMRNGVCGVPVEIGDTFDPGTGFAGVVTGFNDRLELNPIVTIPVVKSFPNGSSTDVEIVGFVVMGIVSQKGKGSKWSGELEFLKNTTGTGFSEPRGEPWALTRGIVK